MTLSGISSTSLSIVLFRYFYKCYDRIEQKSLNFYCHSQLYTLTKHFWEKAKICFRYSLGGRITNIRQTHPKILDNSQTVQYLVVFYKKWEGKIIHYLNTSLTLGLEKDMKKGLYFLTIRVMSAILVTAIAVNVALSFVFQKPIGLWGWLMRGLFFFAAVSGLFCKADWPSVKESSVFLRKMWGK